jgi:hypothetical protein
LFGQQWANQIGFGPEFWHTLFMRANIPEGSPMDNFGFKPVRTAGTHFFIDSNIKYNSTKKLQAKETSEIPC